MNRKMIAAWLGVAALTALLFLARGKSDDEGTGTHPQPLQADPTRKEAPMLEKLVAAGELPPLSERLPRNPAIVEPVDRLGRYGGVWHRYAIRSDSAGMSRINYDPALRWSTDGLNIQPNMCWKYEVSEDHRVFTFWLREGVHWSDGNPLTTEDVEFWWEDFILNKDVHPLVPPWIQINGKLPKLVVLGPYTFRFEFPQPYGLFLERVAWQGNMWKPKHYLMQFHERYRSKKQLDEAARAADFKLRFELFKDKVEWRSNPDLPMATAWVVKNEWSSYHRVFERNPYYWKVDTAGRQLPYIDRVTHDTLQNRETALFSLMRGDVLMQNRHIEFKDFPLLQAATKGGKIEIYHWIRAGNHGFCLMVNQSYTGADEFARQLLRERKFRWALSHALHRKEISELFFFGFGEPRQPSPIVQSPYYEYGRRYSETALEYDLEKANRLLDELGLTERDSEGYRLRRDGKPIELTVDHSPTAESAQLAEYFSLRCLASLGIKGILKPATGARGYAGLLMLVVGHGFDRNMQVLIAPSVYVPHSRYVDWATQYGLWYESNGKRGWEPPEAIARIQRIYDEIKISPDRQKRYQLMGRIFDIHADNLWVIGAVAALPELLIVSPRAGNIPRNVVSDWLFMTPGNAHPEQFYAKW